MSRAAVGLRRSFPAMLLLLLVGPVGLHAQDTRDELIANALTAYDEFETARALDLLQAGLNPALGLPDSTWQTGVQLLAQILIEEGREDVATTWLRWAVRLKPELEVDSVLFLPEVVRACHAALEFVGAPSPADRLVKTRWEWAERGSRDSLGALRVQPPALDAPVRVLAEGVGAVDPGKGIKLVPGSYTIRAEAEGYRPTRVDREVLPAVTTVLSLELEPLAVAAEAPTSPEADSVLPSRVEARSLNALARLSVRRFGTEPACGSGFFIGPEGLLLTTYWAIRGADSVELELPTGRRITDGIAVAAYDLSANVAVLKVPTQPDDSLELARDVLDGQLAWALGYPDCRSASTSRLHAVAWEDRPQGLLQLADSLPAGLQGGPLIDRTGAVLGLGAGREAAVPAFHLARTLDQARRNVIEQDLLTVHEVGLREKHAYGSVAISSDLSGAVARISPLEAWHWAETSHAAALPFTYSGPMGRYKLDLLKDNRLQQQSEFNVVPGTLGTLSVTVKIAVKKPGKFPWPIAALGVAGAGGAVALLAGGGGGGAGGDGGGTPSTTGGIIITIPNP